MKTRVATAVAAAKLVAAHATDVCSSCGANAPLRKNGGGGGNQLANQAGSVLLMFL